jgi:hypothetical protein
VLDELRAVGERLPGPQAVRADEGGAHAVGKWADNIAAEAVADEQPLVGRCLGGGKNESVKTWSGFLVDRTPSG